MVTEKKAKNILILSGVFLLLSIGVFIGAIYYLNIIGGDIPSIKNEVSLEKQAAEASAALERSLNVNAGSIESIDSFFVLPEEEAGFIKNIEDLAKSSKTEFSINTFSHLPVPDNDKFEYVTMRGTAIGVFQDVYKLLVMIESFPKGLIVEDVEMEYFSGDPKVAKKWRLSFYLKALKVK